MRSTLKYLICYLAVCGCWGSVCGCGKHKTPTYPISGTVTFSGKPVAEGDILLIPDQSSYGPNAGKIKAGHFAFPAIAGKKRVEIRARRLVPGAPPGPMNAPVTEDYIPPRYNSETELTVTVIPEGPNVFNLDLQGDR